MERIMIRWITGARGVMWVLCALGAGLRLCADPAHADVIHVPDDYPAIGDAIEAAEDGDEIIVAEGEYFEHFNLLGKAITLRSTDPEDPEVVANTIVNGDGALHVVVCNTDEGPDTIINGFTVTGGEARGAGIAPYGGGMLINTSNPTVMNCVFTGNTATRDGGGMYAVESDGPTVTTCVFRENTADQGGGMRSYQSHPTLIGCTFLENVADEGRGGYSYSSDTMYVLCTFSGNKALFGGAMCIDEGETLSNCILWGNSAPDGPEIWGPAIATYCDVQGGYEGEGNIDADPQFIDPESGDYRLSPGSPCIDAGDNTAVPPAVADLDEDGDTDEPIPIDLMGQPRFVDDPNTEDTGHGEPPIVDMAACEFQVQECPADFDGDGDVDTADLLILLARWGTDGSGGGDVDGDGDVDTQDLLLLLDGWGPCS
jgi:hypothetical protein